MLATFETQEVMGMGKTPQQQTTMQLLHLSPSVNLFIYLFVYFACRGYPLNPCKISKNCEFR